MDADRAAFDIPLRRSHIPLRLSGGLGALAFAGYSGWIALAPSGKLQEANFGSLMIALISVAAAGIGLHSLAIGWKQARHPRPGLRVDLRGLHDSTRGDGGRFIAWDEIDHFEWTRDDDYAWVLHACRQQAPAPDHAIFPSALLDDGRERWTIDCANLAMDPDELEGVLQRHLAMHRRRRVDNA